MHFVPVGTDGLPRECAILPGRNKDDEGFIDTGRVLQGWDRQVFLSKAGLREAARIAGLPTEEQLNAATDHIADLTEQIGKLEEANAALEDESRQQGAWLESIDVLESEGFRTKRHAGRPKQKAR